MFKLPTLIAGWIVLIAALVRNNFGLALWGAVILGIGWLCMDSDFGGCRRNTALNVAIYCFLMALICGFIGWRQGYLHL